MSSPLIPALPAKPELKSPASNASMTQLPPSPELKSSMQPLMAGGSVGPGEFSLLSAGGTTLEAPSSPSVLFSAIAPTLIRRLRSVARYQAFHPQALACSDILTSSFNEEETPSTTTTANRPASKDPGPSSLGAVAGTNGVALFRLSRPHVPLLILSHATTTNTTTTSSHFSSRSVSSMAFQPTLTSTTPSTPQSLYLAATRGTGILIWDASGHSPNPLVGRLGSDQINSQKYGSTPSEIYDESRITSVAWKPSTSAPLLGTTTAHSLSLWDLRSSSGANPVFKPNLRFGTARRVLETHIPLVQAAFSSESNDCATMDSAGVVRVYDIRMADRSRSYMGSPISQFAAHETAGIGISYFPEANNNNQTIGSVTSSSNRWLTWGLDSPFSSSVVKIWKKDDAKSVGGSVGTDVPGVDEYWAMSDSISHSLQSKGSSGQSDYSLIAQCVRPNLACARVASSPVENSFVAIGHIPSDPKSPENRGWWAELYTVESSRNENDENPPKSTIPQSSSHGLKKVAGFQGGTSNNSGDKNALMSVLGNQVDLGNLTAAELGFSRAPMQPRASQLFDDVVVADKEEDEIKQVELLLCCMSDSGVVTTHVIPEAIPRAADNNRALDMSPKWGSVPRASIVRTAFSAGVQTRVYPDDREGSSFIDAAGFWGGTSSKQGADAAKNRMEEARHRLEQLQPPQFSTDINEDPPTTLAGSRDTDGGLMPFDMDVPVAYGSVATSGVKNNIQLGITDMASGTMVSSTTIGGIEEIEALSADTMDSTTIMENIETERVPCPRLCGATFGMGAGGLVVFHNGEVKKMWNWYQRTDALRLTGVLGGKLDNPAAESDNFRSVKATPPGTRTSNPLSPSVEETTKQVQPDNSGPRTLKELVNMISTAKEAQWGDHAASDDSASQTGVSAGDNFFEEESLDSNSSDSGDALPLTPPAGNDMYGRYFGGRAWKGTIEKSSEASPPRVNSPGSPSNPKSRSIFGPSSDMLAPVVEVSHELNDIVLNHQSAALAIGWELGSWDSMKTYQPSDVVAIGDDGEQETKIDTEYYDDPETSVVRKGLPHYRYLASPERKKTILPIPRPKSDPNLFKHASHSGRSSSVTVPLDEPGVHGGEYTVRPNMEESMTFLKKLFTHQQEGARTTFMSPPDSPRLFSNLSKGRRPSSANEIRSFQTYTHHSQIDETSRIDSYTAGGVRLGVYAIVEPKINKEDEAMKRLENIKRICLHNAKVCEGLGASEKEGVWKLLAQTVENQMDSKGKLFNGWGGAGGGALGVDLVANLLEFYEKMRDVQMLATMYCVLSGGRRDELPEHEPYLLPQGDGVSAKYDAYIKKYAELLYSWGLLNVRAELNKHLLRVPQRREGDISMEEHTETGRSPGIAVVFQCPTCGRDADFNTNYCRACRDFAFRCCICNNSVRGLFTVCDICHHGGHIEHMRSWFSSHVECPTGCGCTCSFSSFMPTSTEIPAAAEYE